jgi:hypothetical protein
MKLGDVCVGCIGAVIGLVAVLLSVAFAPVVWLYGMLGGRK